MGTWQDEMTADEKAELLAELQEEAKRPKEEYFGRGKGYFAQNAWERKGTMEKIICSIFQGSGKEETLREEREEFIKREEERDERYREIMEEEYPYIYEKYILGYDKLLTLVEQYRSEASSLRSELDNM